MRRAIGAGLVVMMVGLLAGACDSGPTGPVLSRAEVAGTYEFTTLRFDPQGSRLESIDLLARLDSRLDPRLVLTQNGEAQISYHDVQTGLVKVVQGSYITTADAVTITWDQDSDFGFFALSRRMSFTFTANTENELAFSGSSPDGVALSRLTELAPELADEPLTDPVPGDLEVELRQISG